MLPDRSKRYAGNDGEIPRLRLASSWQLLLVALLVLALLVLIFPRKTLVENLYAHETLDELTLSYIQNLYRADTKNADVAILLAKSQQGALDLTTLESMLLPLVRSDDTRQRTEARIILAKAYATALTAHPDVRETARLRAQLTDLLQKAGAEEIPERHARIFATAAFQLNLPRLGLGFLERIETGHSSGTLEQYGQEALGKGEYDLAAEYFLMARDLTSDMNDARRLLQKGVGTLMAASQFRQAMLAADQHLGNLEDDPATLRYLARTALAAGEPAQAANYARRLVFQANKAESAP